MKLSTRNYLKMVVDDLDRSLKQLKTHITQDKFSWPSSAQLSDNMLRRMSIFIEAGRDEIHKETANANHD